MQLQWIGKPSRHPAGEEGDPPKLTHTTPLASPSRTAAEQASTGSSPPTANWLNSTDLKVLATGSSTRKNQADGL